MCAFLDRMDLAREEHHVLGPRILGLSLHLCACGIAAPTVAKVEDAIAFVEASLGKTLNTPGFALTPHSRAGVTPRAGAWLSFFYGCVRCHFMGVCEMCGCCCVYVYVYVCVCVCVCV